MNVTLTVKAADGATKQIIVPVTMAPRKNLTRVPLTDDCQWGHYYAGESYNVPAGAKNMLTHLYVDSSSYSQGMPDEYAAVAPAMANGEVLHLAFGLHLFSSAAAAVVKGAPQPYPAPAPDGAASRYYSYQQMISGALTPVWDGQIASVNRIRAKYGDVILLGDPDVHEMDLGGVTGSQWADPRLFAQAAAAMIDYFAPRVNGSPIEWVFCTSGYVNSDTTLWDGTVLTDEELYNTCMGIGTPYDLAETQRVTWHSTDPYIDGTGQDPTKLTTQYFGRLDAGDFGSPAWRALPRMLSEWNIGQGAGASAAALYAGVPAALKGKVHIASLFDSANGAAAGSWHNYSMTATTNAEYVAMTNMVV